MPVSKGYAVNAPGAALVPYTFERRHPADDDVVIAIQYCGICHTDLHLAGNDWGGTVYPLVPGHEITGVVLQVGAGVRRFRPGDRVGVGCYVDSCTGCAQRDTGREQYRAGLVLTSNGQAPGAALPTYGGYADRIVVREGYVLKMPDQLPLDAAAPLLCAGISMYSPLRHWRAGPGKRVAIVGLGGLGHLGVKLARAMGAEVTVLSRTRDKRSASLQLGAQHHYATGDAATFAALAGRFDLILSTVSEPLDWNAYLGLLDVDGALVLVGAPAQPVAVSAFALVPYRRTLAGSMLGSIEETAQMLAFCAQHGIVAEVELVAPGQINQAWERLRDGAVPHRFVIDLARAAPQPGAAA